MAKYTYFKRSGKYYDDAVGANVPITGETTTRELLLELNGGTLPGLGSTADDFYIVITDDDESYPRLLHPIDAVAA